MSSDWYEDNVAPKLYFDTAFDVEAARILPGGYYATPSDMMLVTTLGSCVAACIRDPLNGIGGMNRAQNQVGRNFVDIVENYNGPAFGFASRNYYAQFLAAREIANNPNLYIR